VVSKSPGEGVEERVLASLSSVGWGLGADAVELEHELLAAGL